MRDSTSSESSAGTLGASGGSEGKGLGGERIGKEGKREERSSQTHFAGSHHAHHHILSRHLRKKEYDIWQNENSLRIRLLTLLHVTLGLLTLFVTYLNLIYGVKFDAPVATAWITSSMYTVAIDIFVKEPCNMFFFAFATPWLSDIYGGLTSIYE